MLRFATWYLAQLFAIIMLVRPFLAWMGLAHTHPVRQLAFFLSDWYVEPVTNLTPAIGKIEYGPIAAWILLQIILIPIL
ncbi:MAG: YggT family protein [Gemmatimonadota bacterium]|nr:YggT family protein [Gemmatimonadota bacterium]